MKRDNAWLIFAFAASVVFAICIFFSFLAGMGTGFSFTLHSLDMNITDYLTKAIVLRGVR